MLINDEDWVGLGWFNPTPVVQMYVGVKHVRTFTGVNMNDAASWSSPSFAETHGRGVLTQIPKNLGSFQHWFTHKDVFKHGKLMI